MELKNDFLEPGPTTEQLVALIESTGLRDIVNSIDKLLKKNSLVRHCVRTIFDSYCTIYVTDLSKHPPASYTEAAMLKDLAMVAPEIAGLWLQLRVRVVSLAADWLLEVCEADTAQLSKSPK